ncbi:branched-chain amino acid ABC transporter permease [Dehalobacterium formicoaceticum]|uniref:Branched-chain amino acid ABC transporter permease n=1 Tax=Dehalobacterium formicoaceticum TaxID=51515 RepID=A0ABT1Y421_9FIRM|nr:branched-chain amino acid ABC transporter permease [Dehalobacterium formicoaceticum]MCR6545628.1 branched-chain amino acid ABC transporter permease [Dehalobacterium formicoaceticum]
MEIFIQQLINGIALGSIYALIALGYTMVYGIIKLINFAHGDIYMVGAFVAFFMISIFDMPFSIALLVAMAACALLGMIIERVAYKPLRNQDRLTALITAIGVSFFLEYTMIYLVKPDPRAFPASFQLHNFHIGNIVISSKDLIIFAISLGLMLLLTYVVNRTKTGKSMRAVSYDSEAAQLMGIDVNKTISATFALGSALAAAAGVLVGMYYGQIEPLMGIMPGLKAFIAAVIGGIGIIPGAAFGGLILGVTESLVSGAGYSMLRDAVAFIILIIILIVKPTGLMGKNVKEKV